MRGNKIAAVSLSVLLAVSCTGCAAVTDLLNKYNIDIPFLAETNGENAAEGETSAAGATGADAETASAQEPEAEMTPEEIRRASEGKVLNIFCWDESLESLFIMSRSTG